MMGSVADRAEELAAEKVFFLKSENDIQRGRLRLRHQVNLLRELQADGHDTSQAERLVEIMKATLVEWERHHVMIAERIAYLETAPPPDW
jgi:hypothetical protein